MAKRYSLSLNKSAERRLRELAEAEDISMSEIVRRALALYAYAQQKAGEDRSLSIVDAEGNVEERIVLTQGTSRDNTTTDNST